MDHMHGTDNPMDMHSDMDHMHGTGTPMDMNSMPGHNHGGDDSSLVFPAVTKEVQANPELSNNSLSFLADMKDDCALNHDPMTHMMYMYFHYSNTATVLLQNWQVNSVGTWFGTCLAIFVMAMLYEGLKVLRENLLRRSVVNIRPQNTEVFKDSKTMLTETHGAGQSHLISWAHILQTFLHTIQVTISYFLMLIFMTYNVYLCIPVIVGAGVGYFVFGWKRSIVVDVNEHCH